MKSDSNSQIQLAFEFVQFTGNNIFLTGKAGTGKTTFLQNLKSTSSKRMVVVAPTGVAAINAGGVTIHSFFQLPFGPIVPLKEGQEGYSQNSSLPNHRFSREKINIIKTLDLLIIDEISMVRADVLDGIDQVLRRFKNRYKPFGGIQLLMIGDLYQLAPIVKDEEWEILKNYYPSLFFFHSRALKKTKIINIELKHIYRQDDQVFIELLNKIREKNLDTADLQLLNRRYLPEFLDHEGYITLTTHNYQARQINDAKLSQLPGELKIFHAKVDGDFPEYSFPTDFELELKVGAQVMFVKNDPSREKNFFNGKIGVIDLIDEEVVMVCCENDPTPIAVEIAEWNNVKYSLDETTQEIKEKLVGSFFQYPLRLAWAITIHKSQGLTFSKAIIDANLAFAHGQVYVALSRCKSLEGLVLRSVISQKSIIQHEEVSEFTAIMDKNPTGEDELKVSKRNYQKDQLLELFDFYPISYQLNYLHKLTKEHASSFLKFPTDDFLKVLQSFKTEMIDISEKFKHQLENLLVENQDVENNPILQERIKKGSLYFCDKMKEWFPKSLHADFFETDNKSVGRSVNELVDRIKDELNIKHAGLLAASTGFSVAQYQMVKVKSILGQKLNSPLISQQEEDTDDHKEVDAGIYQQLKTWRDKTAKEKKLPHYMVLSLKTMNELATRFPRNLKELSKIKGIGKVMLEKYGDEILAVIHDFENENPDKKELNTSQEAPENKNKQPKTPSPQVSFDLYKSGKSLSEIAEFRTISLTTVENHLATFVSKGLIPVTDFVTEEKLLRLLNYFKEAPTQALAPAKQVLGEDYSWSELRFALQHMAYLNSKN